VTIRTREAEPPTQFPPARLFLEDIDEIVRILVEAAATQRPSDNGDKPKVTLTTKGQVCDTVEELPKIAKKTLDLSVEVETQKWSIASVKFYRYGTYLGFYGVPTSEKLIIFHKLEPIFRRRNRWLAALVIPFSRSIVTLVMLLALASVALVFIPIKHAPPRLHYVFSLLSVTIASAFLIIRRHHSIVILHHSSEPSAVSQGLRDKLPAALIGATLGSVLTFLLTMLGLYLKHKYWP
jgi:hypothetical protein